MMSSICPPTFPFPRIDHSLPNLNVANSIFTTYNWSKRSFYSLSRISDSSFCCRCNGIGREDWNPGSDNPRWWDFGLQESIRNVIKQIESYFGFHLGQKVKSRVPAAANKEEENEAWDWERWMKHFVEVDEQERLISILKTQLANAIKKEDYEDAARLKVAIAAAAKNDTVGKVMSNLKKSVEEERYEDALLLRDYAGAGLVGWWAGISEDSKDPYGRIIHISAEYGRYIAKSYSPMQLATSVDGVPLFEVYLTNNIKGQYEQQAVYLNRRGVPRDLNVPTFKSLGTTGNLDSRGARMNGMDLFERISEESEDGEDIDGFDDSDFDNVLRDMIPGVKVKVVKLNAPEKVDKDLISKVIEQMDDDEEEDYDLENIDSEDDVKSENEEGKNDIERDPTGISEDGEQNQIAVQVVVHGGLIPKITRGTLNNELHRVPARLEKDGLLSFTFTVEGRTDKQNASDDGQFLRKKRVKSHGQRSVDHVMLDLVKSIGKGKIPMKVLKDLSELINLTFSQARSRQLLSGSTSFHRIDISSSSDPLHGLYIGAHGLYTSEIIHIKHRFGQWDEDGSSKKPPSIEFYEYVEAVKLTGDPYVPAGQVAFRAKVGKRHQLPHKGIIPEEFGVIARYKGQGRLAEPGFKNPRWVDGELVILDGKHIRGGPIVGFIYWAPEYHFLVFFNRLRLQD